LKHLHLAVSYGPLEADDYSIIQMRDTLQAH